MKIKYIFFGLFFVIIFSCKSRLPDEYNRFNGSDESFNKLRLLYVEKNYKQAEKYIGKIENNDAAAFYIQAKIYYYLNKYDKSLHYLNKIKKKSGITEYVSVLKADNNLKLNKFSIITNSKNNIHNIYLKYRMYLILANAFNMLNKKNRAYYYFKKFFNNYNNFYSWRIRKYLTNEFYKDFFNFIKILSEQGYNNEIVFLVNRNFNNIRKKKNKRFLLDFIEDNVSSNISALPVKELFNIGKKYFYYGKYETASKIFKSIILRAERNDSIKLKSYYFLALMNKKEPQKFRENLNNIMILYGNSNEALYYMGSAYEIAGMYGEAEKFFRMIITGRNKTDKYVKKSYLRLLSFYAKQQDIYDNILINAYKLLYTDKDISKKIYINAIKYLNFKNIKQAEKFFILLKNNKFFGLESLFFLGKINLIQEKDKSAFDLFRKYIIKADLNYLTLQSGKYIKRIFNKEYLIKNRFIKYFLGSYEKIRVKKDIIYGKKYKDVEQDKDFKIMKIFFDNGLTFEGKLQLYILKKRYKKGRRKLYYTLLDYFNKSHIINEALNLRIILLKKEGVYKKILFFDNKDLKHFFPVYYSKYLDKIISGYKVKKSYAYSLIYAESLFNQEATSPDNAMGLFQLIPSTAKLVSRQIDYKNESYYHAVYNAHLGLKYLSVLLRNFDNNYIFALSAYNAGGRRIKRWIKEYSYNNECRECFIELIPFTETRNYVKKILFYKYFYNKLGIK